MTFRPYSWTGRRSAGIRLGAMQSVFILGYAKRGFSLGIMGWVLLLIENVLPFCRLWPFGRPISGLPSWGLAVIDGSTAFRLPGGGSLSVATERDQRAPRDFVPGPYQGVPPGPPQGWGKRPIPSYPCGAIRSSLRGEYPLRLRLRGRRQAAEDGAKPRFYLSLARRPSREATRSRPQAGTPNTAN